MKIHRFLVAGAGLFCLAATTTFAGPKVSTGFDMSAGVSVRADTVEGCRNNPGPYISLTGDISLGGLDARLRFSNNLKGTHQRNEDVTTTISLMSDEPIHFAKQPSRGGVGGNPHIWLLLTDPDGASLADAIYLGRCVQGFTDEAVDVILPALAEAEVTGGGCSGKGGPDINLEGGLTLGGLDGTLVFTNNNNHFTHVHEEDVTVGLTLIPEGETIVFPKAPPQGGVGGNPHIFLQFLDGDGNPIGDEYYLGRCNKL
jgi:hypothetical protein